MEIEIIIAIAANFIIVAYFRLKILYTYYIFAMKKKKNR